jgi:hypothetical protein
MKKNDTKIVLDLMMAITFVLLMNPRVLNGLPFHCWSDNRSSYSYTHRIELSLGSKYNQKDFGPQPS